MTQEQEPTPRQPQPETTTFKELREDDAIDLSDRISPTEAIDPYEIAGEIYSVTIQNLQREGQLRLPAELQNEDEAWDHFDQLDGIYKEICSEMGLAWPPPAYDDPQ